MAKVSVTAIRVSNSVQKTKHSQRLLKSTGPFVCQKPMESVTRSGVNDNPQTSVNEVLRLPRNSIYYSAMVPR